VLAQSHACFQILNHIDGDAEVPETMPLAEQILSLIGDSDKKNADDLAPALSGSPAAAAINKALKGLVKSGQLYAHGKGKSLTYAKFPEPIQIPLGEQILALMGDTDKKNAADLAPHLTGSPTPASINRAMKGLTESGKLHPHGKGKSLTYARFPEPIVVPLDEQILALISDSDKKNAADLTPHLTGSPTPAAINKALKGLTESGKLHPHGKGKSLTYAKFPVPILPWYETDANKKSFASLLTSARKLIDAGAANVDGLLQALREKLGVVVPPPSASAPSPPPPSPLPHPTTDLRTTLREAYDYLCKFVEFRDKIVELRRLYYETLERIPSLTVEAFHAELEALNGEWLIELRQLNEVAEAQDRHLAIERDDRLYYYIRWK